MRDGYRPQMGAWQCAASMFGPRHSETVNAWSLLAIMVCSAVIHAHNDGSASSRLLLASVCVHAPVGAAYHTFKPHSRRAAELLLRADFTAVLLSSVLLSAALSKQTPIAVWLSAGFAIVAATLLDPVHMKPHQLAGTYATAVALYTWPVWFRSKTACLSILAALGIGASLYVTKWPECATSVTPVLTSHELMHGCLGAAHLLEWLVVTRM